MLRLRVVAAMVALGVGVIGVSASTVTSSAAAEECWQNVEVRPGVFTYVNTCAGGPGSEPGDGSGGSSEPTCELTGLAEYCIGANACWANVPSALDPATWPEETRPSPDAVYTFQFCDPDPSGTLTGWSWYTPSEMTVAQAARQAFGLLVTPGFSVGFSPPGRAIVGFPTWWWAQTAQAGVITGSSALGVVVPRQALWQGPLVAGGDLLKESDRHVECAGVPGRGEGPGRAVDPGR